MQTVKPLISGALALVAITTTARAATIGQQYFDGAAADTLTYTVSGAGGAVSTATGSSDTPANSRILSGTSSFQTILGTSVLTFDPVSVANYDSSVVELRLAALSATSANGLDATDVVKVFISIDGATYSTTADLTVGGFANARWSYTSGTGVAQTTAGTPATFAPIAGGARTTDGYSTLRIALPDSASTVAFRVTSTNDNSGEIWAIDNVALTGTATNALPEPATLGVLVAGGTLLTRRRRA